MKIFKHPNNLIQRIIIALSICFPPTLTYAADTSAPELVEFTAYYKVIKGGITIGETKRTLKAIEPGLYQFSSETSPRGLFSWISDAYVIEQSQWRLENNEFQPMQYHYRNSKDDKIRDVKLMFDWEKQRVTNIINGDPWHMALHAGLQDKLLYQLKMMHDLQSGAENLSYSVADGGKIKQYTIDRLGEETLDIPLGQFVTTKLQRVTDTKTTIWWCAEQLQFLPIKIQQKKHEGSRVVAVLYKLEGIAVPEPIPEPTSAFGQSTHP